MESNLKAHVYVCYHKPATLISDGSFLPIQVGAALSQDSLNILSDDKGLSISNKNDLYCELTAVYWAWKNDLEGDWLGLMHYRRFFDFAGSGMREDQHGCINAQKLDAAAVNRFGLNASTLEKLLSANESTKALLPKKWSVKKAGYRTIKEHYEKSPFHHAKDLELARTVIGELRPEFLKSFDRVMVDHEGYFTNMFVFDRALFNEYCEWLFSILFEVEARIDMTNYSSQERRVLGYLSERLINVFLLEKFGENTNAVQELPRVFVKDVNYQVGGELFPSPACPPSDAISLTIASDDNFVPHLAALIESIKYSISTKYSLDLLVLDGGIKNFNKVLLERQFYKGEVKGRITFVDCSSLYKNIATHMHFSTATFYRLGLGRILKNHKKVIYIDCDTIVLSDLAALWEQSLDGKVIAAAPDVIMRSFMAFGTPAMKEAGGQPASLYVKNKIGLTAQDTYFQAGVIVFDLDRFREVDIEADATKDLVSNKYWFLDQDILNKYLAGQVKYIDTAWNCVNVAKDVENGLDAEWSAKVNEDLQNPRIIHYAGFEAKPWNNPSAPLAPPYWYYLRQTYWYESVIRQFEHNDSVHASLNRTLMYRILRRLWRSLPEWLRTPAHGVSQRYVRFSTQGK